MKRALFLLPLILLAVACQDRTPTAPPGGPQFDEIAIQTTGLNPVQALGKFIYFDTDLSVNKNQACATCHDPDFGFTGPNPGVNLRESVYPGSIKYRAGNRKPPAAAYAAMAPMLHYDLGDDVYVGGNFWDGRATGMLLGGPAADQAIGPFLNPAEQALPDALCVVYRIAQSSYADLWEVVWNDDLRTWDFPAGVDKDCRKEMVPAYGSLDPDDVLQAYYKVGLSIEAFELSDEVNPFSSKYDYYLAGQAELSPLEQAGLALFEGKAMCSACHPSEGEGALFTDFTYDNLGIPANPLNPVYAQDPDFVDLGLGGFLESQGTPGFADFYGAVKVPTLRNVAKAPGNALKAYGHNGVFKSLEQIVHFYNTRDTFLPDVCDPLMTLNDILSKGSTCWPEPEVADNVNTDELGNLGLTPAEEAAIVAFLKTLSDGWTGR